MQPAARNLDRKSETANGRKGPARLPAGPAFFAREAVTIWS